MTRHDLITPDGHLRPAAISSIAPAENWGGSYRESLPTFSGRRSDSLDIYYRWLQDANAPLKFREEGA